MFVHVYAVDIKHVTEGLMCLELLLQIELCSM